MKITFVTFKYISFLLSPKIVDLTLLWLITTTYSSIYYTLLHMYKIITHDIKLSFMIKSSLDASVHLNVFNG